MDFFHRLFGTGYLHHITEMALKGMLKTIIAQHAPLGMLHGDHLGAVGKVEKNLAHLILALHYAKRGGENKVGGGLYPQQRACLAVEVLDGRDEGADIILQGLYSRHLEVLRLHRHG